MAKPVVSASVVRRATSAHGLLGVAISAVLYIVCLSGTVSVFKDELEFLEQRTEIPRVISLGGDALMHASNDALERDQLTTHLLIYPPTSQQQLAVVSTDTLSYYVDQRGDHAVDKLHPWSSFLIDLHYYLHLPKSFGMLVVAVFGVLLFGMSLTGVLAHPNIFKDAFSLRRGKSPRLLQTDIHNRLGVWTLPFHLSNSLTGAMIGLASVSVLAIASLNYDGDTAAVYAPVFGGEPAVDNRSAPLARIDLAMNHLNEEYPFVRPVLILLHDPLTEGQYLQVFAEHPDRLIFAEKYNYDGDGNFLGTVGSADGQLGQQVADSVYKVHFGSFGGLPVKIAYAFFGVCLLLIIHAGMRVYFLKHGSRAHFYGAWLGVAIGAPVLLVLSFPVSVIFSPSAAALSSCFWLLLASSITGSHVFYQRKSKIHRALAGLGSGG